MELKQHLIPKLKALRLSGVLDSLDVRTQQALAERWTYGDFLERLLEDEVERRGQKQLTLRLRRATLNSAKTLETFDFTFNPGLHRQAVYDLATGQFIRDKRNVLLCGPTGVGKSHLAQALAHEACRRGFDVVWTDAHKMLRQLNAGRLDGVDPRGESENQGQINIQRHRTSFCFPSTQSVGSPFLAENGLGVGEKRTLPYIGIYCRIADKNPATN